MSAETKIVRQIDSAEGTLTDKTGKTASVRFNLNQIQRYVDGIPSLRSATGSLEFQGQSDAFSMWQSPDHKTLRGAGIEAQVIVDTLGSFKVSGTIKDIQAENA